MGILLWLGLCVAIGYYASSKNRSAVLWALLAFLFSPLLAGLILALLKDKSVQADISELRMNQQQMHDRMVMNERMTAARFGQMEQSLQSGQYGNGQLQQAAGYQNQQYGNAQLPQTAAAGMRKKFCGKCGAPLHPNDAFCQNCGAKV